jgi:exonuclease SbcC
LLGTVTKGRYSAIRILEKYAVEIFDGRTAYPLKRFSGGEQDIAGLCVRLGLSRMTAHQRGIEAGSQSSTGSSAARMKSADG